MIIFKKVKWCNFLSTGATSTEVFLDRAPTTLIVGENGAGKSTILDALCFALFNKPFRNINKPQLVNTINGKNMLVELDFEIGTKKYCIKRGIKPNVFEIYVNGDLLNQDAAARDYQKYLEEQVLKLNFKSFTQIVILGSASFTPFMQLPTGHRREIIEDLLDIRIFSVMNDVLKEKISEIKTSIDDIENEIEIGKTKVKLQQEYINKLEDDKNKRQSDIENEIDNSGNVISGLTQELDKVVIEKDNLKDTIQDEQEVKQNSKQLEKLYTKLSDKRNKLQEDIGFYHSNETCPTCNQNLETIFKNSKIDDLHKKLRELDTAILDLTSKIHETDERIESITETKEKINLLVEKISEYNSKITAEQNYVKKLIKEISEHKNSKSNIDDEKVKLKELAKQVVAFTEKKTELSKEKHYLDIAGLLLKDTGIKTKIVKQYLPVINKLVNKYLQAMDFFVHFELDEAFNETIKSRHRDEFSYASFSEGEKQRIDLALLFTWRTIAKMKNSASTNLLMLDEVFDSSLDLNGTDFVMNLLNMLGDDNNIFVISHKEALFDKFRSVIKFAKQQNYSMIAQK